MMSLKKKGLVASVAAMAMAIGGLGIGASTANAADAIKLINATKNHTYTAFQIGKYAGAQQNSGTDAQSLNVVASSEAAKELIKNAAINAGLPNAAGSSTPIPEGTDPITWLASVSSGSADLRKVTQEAEKLVAASGNAGLTAAGTTGALTATADTNIPVADEGWYLILDTKGAEPFTYGVGALVGTTANIDGQNYKTLNMIPLGQVDVKPDDNGDGENPDADPKKTYVGSLTKDSRVTFTLSANGPKFPADVRYSSYMYKFIDTPEDMELENDSFRVWVAPKGTSIADAKDAGNLLTKETQYELLANPGDDEANPNTDMNKGFIVDMSKYFTALAGTNSDVSAESSKVIVVEYSAKITGENPKNSFKIDDNGKIIEGPTVDDKDAVSSMSFKKIGLTGPLAGAEFQVFDLQAYTENDNKVAGLTPLTSATSDDDGIVNFTNIGTGTYIIHENKAPEGYIVTPGIDFRAVVDAGTDHVATTGTVTWNDEGNTGTWKQDEAVNGVADNSINSLGTAGTLQNVQNLAQLPLTGAYGIAVFTLLALVLGGGALTMVAISKRNKRQGLSL